MDAQVLQFYSRQESQHALYCLKRQLDDDDEIKKTLLMKELMDIVTNLEISIQIDFARREVPWDYNLWEHKQCDYFPNTQYLKGKLRVSFMRDRSFVYGA